MFVFPIVLAGVLGFAFRGGGVAPTKIAVVDTTGAEQLIESFSVDEHLEVELFESREEALAKLRSAAVDGVVEPADSEQSPRMTFDPVRPDSETARLRILRALAAQ